MHFTSTSGPSYDGLNLVSEKNTDFLIATFDQILEQVEFLTDQKVTRALRFYYEKEGEKAVKIPHILGVC